LSSVGRKSIPVSSSLSTGIRTKPSYFSQRHWPRHFLIPWAGGAFAPLGPCVCPTTEQKNGLLPQSPQGPRTCIKWMSLTLKRSFKNKICRWAYLNLSVVFECLECLFWEAEIFFKCVLRMQEMLFQTPTWPRFKNFLGACP
jgi:hypothetical protein